MKSGKKYGNVTEKQILPPSLHDDTGLNNMM